MELISTICHSGLLQTKNRAQIIMITSSLLPTYTPALSTQTQGANTNNNQANTIVKRSFPIKQAAGLIAGVLLGTLISRTPHYSPGRTQTLASSETSSASVFEDALTQPLPEWVNTVCIPTAITHGHLRGYIATEYDCQRVSTEERAEEERWGL